MRGELLDERQEFRMLADRFQVGVLLEPLEIVIAERDGGLQGLDGSRWAFGKSEAASEIVVGGGVLGLEPN